jgi:hypothetical protein
MRSNILTGSALALAVLAMGSTQAAACDDCGYCGGYSGYGGYAGYSGYGGYGYYAASYGYYARPAYAYAPAPYYAAPSTATMHPPTPITRRRPPTAVLRPPTMLLRPLTAGPYGRPYYGWRAGYVDASAAARRRGVPAPFLQRAEYTHWAPSLAANGESDEAGLRRSRQAAQTQLRRSRHLRVLQPSMRKPAAKLPVASYGQQPKYIPTAYYGGSGGYGGQRR